MAIRDIFKISRKTFINPAGWIDYDALKFQNQTIWAVLKSLFARPIAPARTESFEEAMQRLNLTEEAVRYGAARYRHVALIFLLLGLLVFFYSFYLLFRHATFLGWLLGVCVSALFFAYAFRYDFWSFQMRRRQLGATFTEWQRSVLGDKDAPQ